MNSNFLFQIMEFDYFEYVTKREQKQQTLIYSFITISIIIFIALTFSMNLINDINALLILRNLFGKLCHQIDNRCFFINGKPMLVCSRCFGIYSGTLVLFTMLIFSTKFRKIIEKLDFRFILLLALPLVFDWTINFIFKYETTNFVRFLTGFLSSIIPVYFLNSLIFRKTFYD